MDPISNLIISIKNAGMAGKELVSLPYSKTKVAILSVLRDEGFIKDFSKKGKKVNKTVEIELLLNENKKPRINGVKRISKQSRRIYLKSKDLKPSMNDFGRTIVSTSKGIMTNKGAKSVNLGGEVLFEIW